jgi:hypothetical protein
MVDIRQTAVKFEPLSRLGHLDTTDAGSNARRLDSISAISGEKHLRHWLVRGFGLLLVF